MTTNRNEYLKFLTAELQVKNVEEKTIKGIAVGYGSECDRVGDIVLPNSFFKSIEGQKKKGYTLPYTYEHGDEIIGEIFNIEESVNGIIFEAKITSDQRFEEIKKAVKQGNAYNSIGYQVVSADFGKNGTRYITEGKLVHVSLVKNPADFRAKILEVKNIQNNFDDVLSLLGKKGIDPFIIQGIADMDSELKGFKQKKTTSTRGNNPNENLYNLAKYLQNKK